MSTKAHLMNVKGHTANYRTRALEVLGITSHKHSHGQKLAIRREMLKLEKLESDRRHAEAMRAQAGKRKAQNGTVKKEPLQKKQRWEREEYSNGQQESRIKRVSFVQKEMTVRAAAEKFGKMGEEELFLELHNLKDRGKGAKSGAYASAATVLLYHKSDAFLQIDVKERIVNLLANATADNVVF